MRKRFIIAIFVVMLLSVVVSCSNSNPVAGSDVATLSFNNNGSVKSLSVTVNGGTDVKDLFWFYTAVKADSGPRTGATGTTHTIAAAKPVCASDSDSTISGGPGLNGYVVSPFSVGSWTFGLYGYTKADRTASGGQLVYSSDTNGTLAAVSASMVNKVYVVVDAIGTGGTGTLKINNITAEEGSPNFYFKVDDAASWTEVEGFSGMTISSGAHAVTVGAFYSETPDTEYKETINVHVYNGFTTTVSGVMEDLVGGVEFDDPETPVTASYHVYYDANLANSGSAPADSNVYKTGDVATVLGQGSLVKDNYTFDGWNTAADGSGTGYTAGSSITIGESDITLYAMWTENVEELVEPVEPVEETGEESEVEATYTVTYAANCDVFTGSVPVDSNSYSSGDSVTVLDNTGNLAREGYTFAGWSLTADGEVVSSDVTVESSDITFYAKWTENVEEPAGESEETEQETVEPAEDPVIEPVETSEGSGEVPVEEPVEEPVESTETVEEQGD